MGAIGFPVKPQDVSYSAAPNGKVTLSIPAPDHTVPPKGAVLNIDTNRYDFTFDSADKANAFLEKEKIDFKVPGPQLPQPPKGSGTVGLGDGTKAAKPPKSKPLDDATAFNLEDLVARGQGMSLFRTASGKYQNAALPGVKGTKLEFNAFDVLAIASSADPVGKFRELAAKKGVQMSRADADNNLGMAAAQDGAWYGRVFARMSKGPAGEATQITLDDGKKINLTPADFKRLAAAEDGTGMWDAELTKLLKEKGVTVPSDDKAVLFLMEARSAIVDQTVKAAKEHPM